MRIIKRLLCAMLAVCWLFPVCGAVAEGDPLLSVDDLMTLEASYSAFLSELEALAVERGLLQESERKAWRDTQMGDFFQNGGYGSILANYTPGVLGYVRAEETMVTLTTRLESGDLLEVLTMRRYTPQDSSLSGLMMTLSVTGEDGVPRDAAYTLSATSGVFLKWDQLLGAYVSVGATAVSEGETVVWSDQTPSEGAKNPIITINVADAQTQLQLPAAQLMLTVDGEGYAVQDGALSADEAREQG